MIALNRPSRPVVFPSAALPIIGLRMFSITLLTPLLAMKNETEPSSSRIVESGFVSSFETRLKIPSTTSLMRAAPSANSVALVSIFLIPSAFASGTIAFSSVFAPLSATPSTRRVRSSPLKRKSITGLITLRTSSITPMKVSLFVTPHAYSGRTVES